MGCFQTLNSEENNLEVLYFKCALTAVLEVHASYSALEIPACPRIADCTIFASNDWAEDLEPVTTGGLRRQLRGTNLAALARDVYEGTEKDVCSSDSLQHISTFDPCHSSPQLCRFEDTESEFEGNGSGSRDSDLIASTQKTTKVFL